MADPAHESTAARQLLPLQQPPLSVPVPSNPTPRRSLSQDSAQHTAAEKSKSSAKPRKPKAHHTDVIDRLDVSGPGSVFLHHDSPFDACAPSRNRNKSKAPMMAWTSRPDAEEDALAAQYSPRMMDSPYPAPRSAAYKQPEMPYSPPKKQVDAIAEAWGIHEPEPYEEFFAGGGSRNASSTALPAKRSKEPAQAPIRRNGTNKLPPPKPIFVPEADASFDESFSPVSSPGAPKRTKSLMHRIRKMRDNPNVPPAGYDEYENLGTSPTTSMDGRTSDVGQRPSRPTARKHDSWFNRGRANSKGGPDLSPTESADFVHVNYDDGTKDLPATPGNQPASYFDGPSSPREATSPGGGLGRKTSLLKKMKGAVRAGRSVERR